MVEWECIARETAPDIAGEIFVDRDAWRV